MHDRTTPVMTTNELALYFTFGNSSINGVLGKGGGGWIFYKSCRTLGGGIDHSYHANGTYLGASSLFVCTAFASMSGVPLLGLTCGPPGMPARPSLSLLRYTF